MLAAFAATRFFAVNIILIILVCGVIGALDMLYLQKKEAEEMIYLELFWSFLQVGLFSIGGGYAAMSLIQDQVVDIHPWLTMTGFADIMAIAEMTPGPIAVNAATFVGIQVAGLPGALIATIGCISPSCVIVMALAYVLPISGPQCHAGHFGRAAPRRHCDDCLCWHFPVVHGPVQAAHFPGGSGQHGSDCTGNFPSWAFCST